MPINWTAEMDRKFFLAVLETSDISVNYAAVAERLSTEDQPCTTVAAQRRLQKLRAMVKAGTAEDDDSAPKAKGKTTPRKRQGEVTDGESPAKTIKHGPAGRTADGLEGRNDDDETIHVKQEE